MNIPVDLRTETDDLTRSDNLDCFDEVDGENEKLDTLSLSLGEPETFVQTDCSNLVEQVDQLAITKDDDNVPDDISNIRTGVKIVDVTSETVLTPSRLTLCYAKDTPEGLAHYLPSLLTVPVGTAVPIGRCKSTQQHIFLNSDTMSRYYGEIRVDGNQAFWLKNVSKTKSITIQFSKRKVRQSRVLKFNEETEVKTNYIVTFHTLDFKVVIIPGDKDAVDFEIAVEMESDNRPPPQEPNKQIIYNHGQIERLYVRSASTGNSGAGLVTGSHLYNSGAGMVTGSHLYDSGINGLPGAGLLPPGYGIPLGAAIQGAPLSNTPSAPHYQAHAMGQGHAGAAYSNVHVQYQPHLLQSQPGQPSGPMFNPLMSNSTNLPPQYMVPGYNRQYDDYPMPTPHQPWPMGGFSQPPPPYYPLPPSTAFNQISSVDSSRSVLVPSALDGKTPEKLHLPHTELQTGASQPKLPTEHSDRERC